jgi:hypothetical protein
VTICNISENAEEALDQVVVDKTGVKKGYTRRSPLGHLAPSLALSLQKLISNQSKLREYSVSSPEGYIDNLPLKIA